MTYWSQSRDQNGDMVARRSTKKIMRSLGIIGEQDGINQQALEEYGGIFTEPISTSHLQALAALFGWNSLESNGLEISSAPLAS
jgi:hypothetical protein